MRPHPNLLLFAFLLSFVAVAPTQTQGSPAAEQAFQAAEQKFEAGEYAPAAEAFAAVTRSEPGNGLAWRRLGYCLHVLDRLDEALAAHLKCTEFAEYRAMGWFNAACVYAMQKRSDDALAALEKAVEAGFIRVGTLDHDKDLNSIRADARFAPIRERAAAALAKADSTRKKVAIVVHENVELLDFAGPAEVLANASRPGGGTAFEVFTVAPRKELLWTQQSVQVMPQYSVDDCPQPDILVIPGGATQVLTEDPRFMEWISRVVPKTEITLSVCTGAFVLAEHGFLDGLEATTHFSALNSLASDHPKVKVKRGVRFVDSGRIITSADISAGIDGALHVVSRLVGEEAARGVARYMEYDRQPAAQTSMTSARAEKTNPQAGAESLYRTAVEAAQGPDERAALAALGEALAAGACPTRALTEQAFQRLHSDHRFRELIRRHAHQSESVLVSTEERGEPLTIAGVVRNTDGKPIAGALIYVFHTDARGYYSAGGMDEDNPRLFGYLKTDAEGRYEFRTIRPGGYHDEPEVDQHIHYFVEAEGYPKHSDRLCFSDDPVWKTHAKPAEARPVTRAADGMQRCVFDITLQRVG